MWRMNAFECAPPTDDARAALEWFRIMADAAPVMIWFAGTDKRSTYFNKRWLEFTGRTLDQELGVGWVEVVHPDDALQCLSTYTEAFDARRDFEIEGRALRHDGCYRWHLNRGRPMVAPDGTFLGYVGTVIDVTDRKRAEAQREELLADGFRDSAMYWLTPNGHIASWNSGAERLKGYRAFEVIGEHFSRFYSDEDIQQGTPERLLRTAGAAGRVEEEGWRLRKNGSRFWAKVLLVALRDDAGRLSGFVKVTRDLTERKRMIDTMLRLRAQREAEERERFIEVSRQRIARDLNDHVAQALFAIGLAATAAIAPPGAPGGAHPLAVETLVDVLARVSQLAATGTEQIRAATFALNQADVVGGRLAPTLGKVVHDFRTRTGIDADLVLTGSDERIDTGVAEMLYSTAREALANVELHSRAGAVLLGLHISSRSVSLSVQDDGDGAPLEVDAETSTGLRRLAEQVLRHGGSFSAGPNPDGGFLVRARLPLKSDGSAR